MMADQKGKKMKWIVVIDISPKTINGTHGCHKYVFDEYKTQKTAIEIRDMINSLGDMGKAHIEKIK